MFTLSHHIQLCFVYYNFSRTADTLNMRLITGEDTAPIDFVDFGCWEK